MRKADLKTLPKEVTDLFSKIMRLLKDEIFAVILYGSYAVGKQTPRSDIDICIVVGSHKKEVLDKVFKKILLICGESEKYDIKMFEEMPLKLKIEVLSEGIVLYAKEEKELDFIKHKYIKIWNDQSSVKLGYITPITR